MPLVAKATRTQRLCPCHPAAAVRHRLLPEFCAANNRPPMRRLGGIDQIEHEPGSGASRLAQLIAERRIAQHFPPHRTRRTPRHPCRHLQAAADPQQQLHRFPHLRIQHPRPADRPAPPPPRFIPICFHPTRAAQIVAPLCPPPTAIASYFSTKLRRMRSRLSVERQAR